MVRAELRRWRNEAEWWREEYGRLMKETHDFVLYMESEQAAFMKWLREKEAGK
jgi:hypothetical protein